MASSLIVPYTIRCRTPASPGHVLKSRSILVAKAALCWAMTRVFVLSALPPLYLTDCLSLDTQKMGLVVSAVGFGGFLGQFGLPGLSDLVGCHLASIVGFVGTAMMLYVFRGIAPVMCGYVAAQPSPGDIRAGSCPD